MRRALSLALVLAATPALAQEPPSPAPPPPLDAPPPGSSWQDPGGCPAGCPQPAPAPVAPQVQLVEPDLGTQIVRRERPPSPASLYLRGSVGAAYTRAVHRSFGAARLALDIGADLVVPVTIAARLNVDLGASQSALPYQRISWGMLVAGRLGKHVRLGLLPQVGFFVVNRATRSDQPMIAFLAGAQAQLTVTLVGGGTRSERWAAHRTGGSLDLDLTGEAAWISVDHAIHADASRLLGASLGLSYRY